MQKQIETQQNIVHISQETNIILSSLLTEKYKDSKKIILTDDNVFELWIEHLVTSVPELSESEIIQIPAGEDSKCIEIATQIWETMSENKIERGDVLINFGGGMISDLGGFIASLFKRGIHFINIPTTLLSQVDASVGGKTGVDLGQLKNQIGVFNHAKTVLINPNYLSTLAGDELDSGYAEMLKHGLIKSEKYWNKLKDLQYSNTESLTGLIYDSIQIKNEIVKADPEEKNERKALNFGHTVGHAIEGYLLNSSNPIKHGHAIALGMIAEAYISFQLKLLNKKDWDEIHYILTDYFEKIPLENSTFSELLILMGNDKKNEGGKINFTLLSGIGSYKINQEVKASLIVEALKYTFS
ncbi:MAG: 3-dehydroquinate synthase [Crocinitomicaceae bacterium]